MGAFILGILAGWLLEWLFFSFWIKGRSSGPFAGLGDSSELKSQLATKDSEIATLKLQLEEKNATAKSAAEKVSSAASTSSAPSTKVTESKNKTRAAKKTTTNKTKASSAKTASSKSTPAKKTSKPSASSTRPASKVATTSKKAAAIKPASTAKKAATNKTAKSTTTTKATSTKAKSKKATGKGDDLTKLSGIGPSMAATLKELGIDTYTKLAAMDDDILRDMLEASGARLNNNKEAMDSWNEQAELAAKGDFDGLKKLQDALKKQTR